MNTTFHGWALWFTWTLSPLLQIASKRWISSSYKTAYILHLVGAILITLSVGVGFYLVYIGKKQ